MAYLKIFPIKVTDKKALDYITNPDKTDEKLLVSSFGCSPETADLEFSMTREIFLRVWTSLRFLFGILIVFYSNSQIKSCLYTFLYKNHGSIWFYMCSTVQSLQTVLNGVINLLSIKNSRNILIPIDDTIDIYILVAYLVDNHIIFPYRIFIVRPKADSF